MDYAISRSLLRSIQDAARTSADEICGLLLGRGGVIEAICPADNVAADPARHFELDPVALIAAHRAARMGGPAVLGHYHSHPSGLAAPSATDLACAVADGSLWLIVTDTQACLWRAEQGNGVDVALTPIPYVVT